MVWIESEFAITADAPGFFGLFPCQLIFVLFNFAYQFVETTAVWASAGS